MLSASPHTSMVGMPKAAMSSHQSYGCRSSSPDLSMSRGNASTSGATAAYAAYNGDCRNWSKRPLFTPAMPSSTSGYQPSRRQGTETRTRRRTTSACRAAALMHESPPSE